MSNYSVATVWVSPVSSSYSTTSQSILRWLVDRWLIGWWSTDSQFRSLPVSDSVVSVRVRLAVLLLPSLDVLELALMSTSEVLRVLRSLEWVPGVEQPIWNMGFSAVRNASRWIRKFKWLWVSILKQLLLSRFQQLLRLHHVLLILVLVETRSQHHSMIAIQMSVIVIRL